MKLSAGSRRNFYRQGCSCSTERHPLRFVLLPKPSARISSVPLPGFVFGPCQSCKNEVSVHAKDANSRSCRCNQSWKKVARREKLLNQFCVAKDVSLQHSLALPGHAEAHQCLRR